MTRVMLLVLFLNTLGCAGSSGGDGSSSSAAVTKEVHNVWTPILASPSHISSIDLRYTNISYINFSSPVGQCAYLLSSTETPDTGTATLSSGLLNLGTDPGCSSFNGVYTYTRLSPTQLRICNASNICGDYL